MIRAGSTMETITVMRAPQKVSPFAAAIIFFLIFLFVGLVSSSAWAQDPDGDSEREGQASVPNDSTSTDENIGGMQAAMQALEDGDESYGNGPNQQKNVVDEGFISKFTNTPKGGVKANDRMTTYYGQWDIFLKMFGASSLVNNTKWSKDEYRKQDKNVEKRTNSTTYNAGTLLPFILSVKGDYSWSEDVTTNTSGNTNLSKRDMRTGMVNASKNKIRTGPLLHSIRGGFGVNIQDAVTQNKSNDFNESNFNGGIKTGMELATGLTVAGRAFGRNVSGDRSLGDSTSPSSATTDSLGVGVYFKRGIATGRVSVTRGNFERSYLAFRTDALGLIDTLGRPKDEQIIEELETKDAVSLTVENLSRIGGLSIETNYKHTTSNTNFAKAAVGLKERSADEILLATRFSVGRDSFAIAYNYAWKWDDHSPNGQNNRGKQYIKDRKVGLMWQRMMFKDTKFVAKYETSLSQDIAENEYNANDKDRLGSFVNLKADRKWGNLFRASLMFGYKSSRDISIRESRSANNNQKDSYEVAPGYTWNISKWLVFTQNYRLYIQYTDYLFSNLDYVDKDGNYNKRGNLNTRVTFKPTSRLTVTVKHDLNKRFNATETSVNAVGTSFYNKDQIQEISKVDLAMVFKVAEGVVIEGATFRTRDDKETFGARGKETLTFGGEVWVGTKVNKKWGEDDQLELSMTVKKINAYGPSVSKESSDYWDADIWLKWSF